MHEVVCFTSPEMLGVNSEGTNMYGYLCGAFSCRGPVVGLIAYRYKGICGFVWVFAYFIVQFL